MLPPESKSTRSSETYPNGAYPKQILAELGKKKERGEIFITDPIVLLNGSTTEPDVKILETTIVYFAPSQIITDPEQINAYMNSLTENIKPSHQEKSYIIKFKDDTRLRCGSNHYNKVIAHDLGSNSTHIQAVDEETGEELNRLSVIKRRSTPNTINLAIQTRLKFYPSEELARLAHTKHLAILSHQNKQNTVFEDQFATFDPLIAGIV